MCVLWLRSMASRLNFFWFVSFSNCTFAKLYTQQQHIAKISSSVLRSLSLLLSPLRCLSGHAWIESWTCFFCGSSTSSPPPSPLCAPFFMAMDNFLWFLSILKFSIHFSWVASSHQHTKKTKIATRSVAQIAMDYAIEFQIFKLNCMRSRCFEARVGKGNKQNRASKQCDNKEKYAIFSVEKHREWSKDGNYSTFWQNCILFVRTLATTFWQMYLKLARICCRCAGSRIHISHEAMNDLSEILPDSFTFIFATKF